MEVYSTEEQQVEAIKNFWKENGTQIILGAVIGLGGFSGWNWYIDKQITEKEAASVQYEAFLETAGIESATYEATSNELAEFTEQYGESGYGVFVQLIAAKQAVEEQKFEKAAEHLSSALSLTDIVSLKELVAIRLARVEIELKQFDSALSHLTVIKSEGFVARAEELKGDVYFAQGETDKARAAYQAAADKGGLEGNNFLEMKLNDLAISKS